MLHWGRHKAVSPPLKAANTHTHLRTRRRKICLWSLTSLYTHTQGSMFWVSGMMRGVVSQCIHHYTATCTSTNHNRRRQTVTHVFLLTWANIPRSKILCALELNSCVSLKKCDFIYLFIFKQKMSNVCSVQYIKICLLVRQTICQEHFILFLWTDWFTLKRKLQISIQEWSWSPVATLMCMWCNYQASEMSCHVSVTTAWDWFSGCLPQPFTHVLLNLYIHIDFFPHCDYFM